MRYRTMIITRMLSAVRRLRPCGAVVIAALLLIQSHIALLHGLDALEASASAVQGTIDIEGAQGSEHLQSHLPTAQHSDSCLICHATLLGSNGLSSPEALRDLPASEQLRASLPAPVESSPATILANAAPRAPPLA